MTASPNSTSLAPFHPAVRAWFAAAFETPTPPQSLGWPAIARGESTLILAPTGSGKTLAAFLWCLDRLMFAEPPAKAQRCRVLYVSPLKALAVDVERNLRAPLAGISQVATARGDRFLTPAIAVRSGDTPAADRARFQREPADILITTPESLYLLLTSNAREALRSVDTVIVDEIHALVPTKRGAHLALSLERLAVLCDHPLQRIGLSATQRPLDEVARFLGGIDQSPVDGRQPAVNSHQSAVNSRQTAVNSRQSSVDIRRSTADRRKASVKGRRAPGLSKTTADRLSTADRGLSTDNGRLTDDGRLTHDGRLMTGDDVEQEFTAHRAHVRYRPITVVDAGRRKALKLTIEVPVEDMARITTADDIPSGPASVGDSRPSIWSAIHPRLLELINAHRSTLIFVNSRRLAERLAGALNELAGETLVRSHHGSIARPQRVEVEDLLKSGLLRALVATSSLELGIDMGAIDLVVQIEAPPSVASGLQRIGRGGHQADAVSEGVIFPKFRGDLVACAAVAKAMHDGAVEATRYPRNPLDIVAQQIVAMTSMDTWDVERLFTAIRSAAPFAELSRPVFEGVLDMLSGRYPSDEFAELRPRVTWDRVAGTLVAREGAKRVAIANGGTIPDRGLFGVFLVGADPGAARVGELDEEMVFESHAGETFVLGASSWRIEEITHDRVLVSPAPGEPGKMPFWKGDRAGRPLELGLAIGRLMHDLLRMPAAAAIDRLAREHDLDRRAAENLMQYLRDQMAAARAVPDAATVVVERVRDELGDWRVCVLSPRGGRIHAPWAMAAAAKIREEIGVDVETLWGDDGFVVRFPDVDEPPDPRLLIPDPDEVQALVVRQLGATALFAAKFRENAARSLLLPKRRPGMRAPLWQQRKRAADLLAVASRFGSFPVLLETYRECLRDVFDMPALISTLADLRSRTVRLAVVDSEQPSPFAASLLFSYVASFLYDGDAPLAERRAQALAVDQGQLRELIGDAELRELLDADSMEALERQLQRLDPKYRAKSADAVHDMLLAIGDLSDQELPPRVWNIDPAGVVRALIAARRAIPVRIAGERRYIAVEDAAKYRDAVGVPLPAGLPESLLAPSPNPLGNLALRYARTHAPFTAADFASRYGLSRPAADAALMQLLAEGRLLEGEFRPGGSSREWTEPGVLGQLRRRSLAKLRHEVEPVDQSVLGRFTTTWQGVVKRRRGPDAILDAIEQLQGAPLAASILETEILPARVEGYDPGDLDRIAAAGEVVWIGIEPLGERDGRVALYLADHLARLRPPSVGLKDAPVRQKDATQADSSYEGRGRPGDDVHRNDEHPDDPLPDNVRSLRLPPPREATADHPGLGEGGQPDRGAADLPGVRLQHEGGAAGLRGIGLPPSRATSASANASADRRGLVPLRAKGYSETSTKPDERESAILDYLRTRGASFFQPLHEAVGGGYPGDTVGALWDLVWKGLVTNDTFHALRGHTRTRVGRRRQKGTSGSAFRSRRLAPPSAEGRWTTTVVGPQPSVDSRKSTVVSPQSSVRGRQSTADSRLTTEWSAAFSQQLLARHGIVTREALTMEQVPGGFSTLYPVLKAMEERGRLRRGYFVAGLGATQFALPGALDLLRSLRDVPDEVEVAVLSATDPANPYGATLPWVPRRSPPGTPGTPRKRRSVLLMGDRGAGREPAEATTAKAGRGPTRSVGATVIMVNGAFAAYLARGDRQLVVLVPDAEPDKSRTGRAIARALIDRAREHGDGETPRGMLIEEIDGAPPAGHPLAQYLIEAGFIAGAMGFRPIFESKDLRI